MSIICVVAESIDGELISLSDSTGHVLKLSLSLSSYVETQKHLIELLGNGQCLSVCT
jgi:hypothetical protein